MMMILSILFFQRLVKSSYLPFRVSVCVCVCVCVVCVVCVCARARTYLKRGCPVRTLKVLSGS
jgi:hypothetical protein